MGFHQYGPMDIYIMQYNYIFPFVEIFYICKWELFQLAHVFFWYKNFLAG